eukprot:CAMPEP_0194503354 /NCGR_PEP_ID=MMETSP0253-20130528/28336_1 /TAXON_ID=2966 /ORGANISM="Noctiluca scintillans" /LENGTH=94 /DNA_ID=CAMNT_0039345631 /DNA_START=94 /DNA_END=378 /DNA_ORIENTATION=-
MVQGQRSTHDGLDEHVLGDHAMMTKQLAQTAELDLRLQEITDQARSAKAHPKTLAILAKMQELTKQHLKVFESPVFSQIGFGQEARASGMKATE